MPRAGSRRRRQSVSWPDWRSVDGRPLTWRPHTRLERRAAPPAVPRGPPRGRGDRGLRAQAPPQQGGPLGEASGSCVAWPPGVAFLDRAGPRPQGIPAAAQRSASHDQGKRPSTATTTPSRAGAMAVSQDAGAVCIWRCSRRAPSWFRRPTAMERACTSRPPETGCGVVEKRLWAPPRA